jgi:pimeloyl-ACP methyl ester carboxylesterase
MATTEPALAGLPQVEGVEHRSLRISTPLGALRVHVAEAGSGAPVLMLHGWPQHWYCWRQVIPQLAADHRLVMPDLRGFGWTEAPGRGYHPEAFAADAIALLDALGLDRVAVLGHDWGGYTAFLLALHHPERVSHLVVCNAPHPWTRLSWRLVLQLWRTWYVLALAAPVLGPKLAGSERFLRSLGHERPDGGSSPAVSPVYAERLRDPARARASSLLYRSYLGLSGSVFLRRRYDPLRLTPPARLLFGREDAYIPLAFLDGLEGRGDDFELELIPRCGHWTPEERPDLVAARARALFSGAA